MGWGPVLRYYRGYGVEFFSHTWKFVECASCKVECTTQRDLGWEWEVPCGDGGMGLIFNTVSLFSLHNPIQWNAGTIRSVHQPVGRWSFTLRCKPSSCQIASWTWTMRATWHWQPIDCSASAALPSLVIQLQQKCTEWPFTQIRFIVVSGLIEETGEIKAVISMLPMKPSCELLRLLADRTNGRAYAAILHPVCRLFVTYRHVRKRCVLPNKKPSCR